MSYRAMPGQSRTLGSMSRGTARSIITSGRPMRDAATNSSSSRPTIWCGAPVELTTMSACSSSPGMSSNAIARPP